MEINSVLVFCLIAQLRSILYGKEKIRFVKNRVEDGSDRSDILIPMK